MGACAVVISLQCIFSIVTVMKVLGIMGSPRRNGNTETLLESILEGARSAGAEADRIDLSTARIEECNGCAHCWKGKECIKKDDMNIFYQKIADSDVIVFATPVYWYGPTGLMKLFLDRFVYFNCSQNRPKVSGKKAILAIPFEEKDPATADAVTLMFRKSFDYLEMELGQIILAPGVSGKEDISQRPEILKEGNDAGRSIVLEVKGR